MSKHGSSVYRKIAEELEIEDFFKSMKGRMSREFELPKNTYVAEFDAVDYASASALTDEIKVSLKRIFAELKVKGKYFVFAGEKWSWKGGNF